MPRATLNESMNENITNQRNRIISFGTIHNCVTPQVRINLLPNYHFSIHTNHLQASTTSTKTSIVIDWELTIGADYRCWFPNRHLLIGAYTSILLVPVNNGTYTSAGCHLAHTLHWRRGRSPRRGGGGQRDPATAPAATTRCTRGGEGKGGGPPGERRPACQNYW